MRALTDIDADIIETDKQSTELTGNKHRMSVKKYRLLQSVLNKKMEILNRERRAYKLRHPDPRDQGVATALKLDTNNILIRKMVEEVAITYKLPQHEAQAIVTQAVAEGITHQPSQKLTPDMVVNFVKTYLNK